jgi:hypothetical protein
VYGNSTGGFASGTRGNPYSNAGSQWAPPPRPPPARDFERRRAPPTSSGAQRWTNFPTPNGTTPRPNVDAESRRQTFEGWERMRSQQARAQASQKPAPKEYTPREESNNFKHAPPPKSSKPSYEEFRAGTAAQSPRTSPSRTWSSNSATKKNGFMPGTPGGDEPSAANTSAYFNYRSRRGSTTKQDPSDPSSKNTSPIDPLRQFREKASAPFEPRVSTPYTTHGGEKTNPFETVNISRSKSSRDRPNKANSPNTGRRSRRGSYDRPRSSSPPRQRRQRHLSPESNIPRADSEANLDTSPKRTFSSTNRGAKPSERSQAHLRYPANIYPGSPSESGDEESGSFGIGSRAYAKPKAPKAPKQAKEHQVPPKFPPEMPNAGKESSGENQRKPNFQALREWRSSLQNNVPNDSQTDEPTTNHSHSDPDRASSGGAKGDPKMYSIPSRIPSHSKTSDFPSPNKITILPRVVAEPSKTPRRKPSTCPCPSAGVSSETSSKVLPDNSHPQVTEWPADSPSGVSFLTPPNALNPFEAAQFKLIEQLVGRCNLAGRSDKVPNGKPSSTNPFSEQAFGAPPEVNQTPTRDQSSRIPRFNPFINISAACAARCSNTERGSPCKRQRVTGSNYCASHLIISGNLGFNGNIQVDIADKPSAPRFSFNAGQSYFPSGPQPSNSTENISTTFTSEDWKGKFEAGDVFGAGKATNGTRARSGSRTRTRTVSPTKRPSSRPQGASAPVNESHGLRESRSADAPIMSPGGTKFNAEEWAKTFMPQTFAPPPFPTAPTLARPNRPIRRPSRAGSTTGKGGSKNASSTTINNDSSDEAGLYMGKGTRSTGTREEPPAATQSPNAMDIDPPLDETPKTPPNAEDGSSAFEKGTNEARNVPLEPSRPEWRAGGVNGASSQPTSTAPKPPDLPPRQPNAAKPRRRVGRSTDSEDFKTNLEELKNVEPLHSPATGLNSFEDLASNLPFQSKASTILPFSREFSTGKLELPNPPRAPMVPPIASDAKRPSGNSWQSFLVAFTSYMAQWNIFNAKMVNHFIGRQNQVAALPSSWLESFGDGSIEKYKEGLKQDEEVRGWWDVACLKHQHAVEEFQWYKECMREGVQKAGPPPKGRQKVA